MKKLLLSTLMAVGTLGAFSTAQAEEDMFHLHSGYAVMQAGMGFGRKDYQESGVFAVGAGYHVNDYMRSDVTVGMRAFGEIEKDGESADSWSVPALLNVYARVPWQKMGMYVMGGLGLSYNHVDGTDLTKSDSKTDFAWTLGAGFDYVLNKCWSMDLGYRYADLGEGRSKLKDGSGRISSDIRSHDVLLTARYHF